MSNGLLLWVDDEIELLKAHIMFLEKKGYEVITVSNGTDAIDQCRQKTFDLVLLDEMMPGLSGLETLQHIKEIQPATPVVMVTKSEEEDIMNQAIGSKIADYLIKPVNPNQILLTLKKNIHQREIVTEVMQTSYQQDFQQISMQIDDCKTLSDWMDVYRLLVRWELELSSTDSSMTDMLKMQKEEANNGFAKFIKNNYMNWVKPLPLGAKPAADIPLLSPDVFKNICSRCSIKVRRSSSSSSTTSATTNGDCLLRRLATCSTSKNSSIRASYLRQRNMHAMLSSAV